MVFFMEQFPLNPRVIPLGPFDIFTKIADIFATLCLSLHGVDATGARLFSGGKDISNKLSPVLLFPAFYYCCVVYAVDYALSQYFIDSMTPVINLSMVTTTPVIINRSESPPAIIYGQ